MGTRNWLLAASLALQHHFFLPRQARRVSSSLIIQFHFTILVLLGTKLSERLLSAKKLSLANKKGYTTNTVFL